MRSLLAFLSGLLIVASVHAQPEEKPRLVPLFSRVEDAPAFMLYCPNDTPAAISATGLLNEIAYRVDGVVQQRTGGIASVFMGGEPILDPGQTWRIMIGLRQSSSGTKSPDFGATLRAPWIVALSAGFHAIALRCASNWTNELAFYWEPATVQPE
jgi:hypothetical protein